MTTNKGDATPDVRSLDERALEEALNESVAEGESVRFYLEAYAFERDDEITRRIMTREVIATAIRAYLALTAPALAPVQPAAPCGTLWGWEGADVKTCRTCKHWQKPSDDDSHHAEQICSPVDQDTMRPMRRGFESRLCKHPSQTLFEAPTQSNGFALTDASEYMACLATGEDFGCVLYEEEPT